MSRIRGCGRQMETGTPVAPGRGVRGLTLIELLVALAVLVILLTVAVPGMQNFVKNNRLTAAANSLSTSMALARSEAVRRGRAVTVCASASGAACDGTAWADGWIVFVDGGTAGSVDTGDEILRVFGDAGDGVTINLGGMTYVRFLPTGMLDT